MGPTTTDRAPRAALEGTRARRTIHYLGSKLRLLEPIERAVADVAAPGGAVCDLFAGSGTVSLALASDWDVTSVDIQEYSRVLCSGLLHPPPKDQRLGDELCERAASGRLREELRAALGDLLAHEQAWLAAAKEGAVEGLCDQLEDGSLLALSGQDAMAPELRRAMVAAMTKLTEGGLDRGPETVITRHFGGRYFSWEQAIDLDALLTEIHALDPPARDHHLAAALAVASEVVNTVGKHFAQPIKPRDASGIPKRHLVRQTLRDRAWDVFDKFRAACASFSDWDPTGGSHRAVRADYREFLARDATPFAAVYADPPYTRDHYSRYYHVLETMALRDDPEVSTTKIRSNGVPRLSRGLYRLDRHQSPFCIPSKAQGAFQALFSGVAARRIPLVVSYSPYQATAGNRPRLLTLDELLDLARRSFGDVECTPVDGMAHNKLNLTERNVPVDGPAEVLIRCVP